MFSELVTERFRNLVCPDSEKEMLRDYLFCCLAEGSYHKLKRNRVMVREQEKKNKFIILDLVPTSNEHRQCYICSKCSTIDISNLLTKMVPPDEFNSCLHTKLSDLLWGGLGELEINVVDNEEEDLIEVITESPKYMAVVHPSVESNKGPGVVILTSKTLNPKCMVCPGQDCCYHLKVHMKQYKHGLTEDALENGEHKRLKIDRIEPVKPQKKDVDDPDKADPFQHDGPNVNVFGVKIDFIQPKDDISMNRKVAREQNPFDGKILVEKYDVKRVCDHGNKYEEKESILFVESTNVKIHHTKEVTDFGIKCLYRPTLQQLCICKDFYKGKEDKLIRVSPANNNKSSRSNTLHFVSYEYYFNFLSQVVENGETLSGFIKSKKFMNEVLFGFEKSPEYKKVLQKGFEIFCHALQFPEDANFCYECPQELEENEKEDDFENEIEISVIDGIQMGCRINDLKTEMKEEYFEEETVDNLLVKGIEAKHRTFLNTQKTRDVITNLLSNVDKASSLPNAVKALSALELDENATVVLELLNRLLSEHKVVPTGYCALLHELRLLTPKSALLVPYSSDKNTYKRFMEYLNNKSDIFASPSNIEKFINKFPIIIECIKKVLDAENSMLPFLPTDVSAIFKNMIKLRFQFDKMSRQVAAPRVTPKDGFVPPKADFFPSYPIHTMENEYKADNKPDPTENDACEKAFNSTTSISGGIGTVTCNHKITKGFRAIKKGESPVIFCHSLLRRLPQKVRARKRVVVYDFACKMHKVCLRRYPYRIRRFQFVIDRHHQSNHKACSQAYNISKYPEMKHVNTQIAEQLNNSLRKLSTVVAYSNFETYLKIIQIFITVKNLKIKGVI